MNIKILDEVFDLDYQTYLYLFCKEAPYTIGWADSNDIEQQNRPFFHSNGDIDSLFLNDLDLKIRNTDFKEELEGYDLINNAINCSRPGETYWTHTHGKTIKVVLYYPNFKWNIEWGGETMFYDAKGKDLIFASEYKSNRMILFDGNIPHSVRAPTYIADQYRFTISFFYHLK
tara:strand:+ start:56 stop:574 length:519 start_codon:yes stop_codon:yes gene_type:complete